MDTQGVLFLEGVVQASGHPGTAPGMSGSEVQPSTQVGDLMGEEARLPPQSQWWAWDVTCSWAGLGSEVSAATPPETPGGLCTWQWGTHVGSTLGHGGSCQALASDLQAGAGVLVRDEVRSSALPG